MLHVLRQHLFLDAHMSYKCVYALLMTHIISRRRFQDMHIPRQSVQALPKGACHWSTLYAIYAHATLDAWKPMPLVKIC